jgi:hypothetical protein
VTSRPTDALDSGAAPTAPAPGSHDRGTPTGSLETSAASLFEAMIAARDNEGGDPGPLHEFYRTLMQSTLLLPVPPDHGEDAKRALASAVNDDAEVEISVMLARDPDGQATSVLFGSFAALSAWAPSGTGKLPLPARIVFTNLASSGLPAIMDPAGPIPYRFEPFEVAALAAEQLPGSDEPLFQPSTRASIRLRLPGPETLPLEKTLAEALRSSGVTQAYLVVSEADEGQHLLLGLVGDEGASVTVDVPDGTDVVWLEEPLLGSVRAVAEPFFRR